MNKPSLVIVEDDRDIRESLGEVLEHEGFAVRTATNGREGLELLRNIPPPSAILLDYTMPVMNGEEFLLERAKDPKLSGVPVLLLTAVGENTLGRFEGAEIIRKPIDLETLLQAIRRVTER